VITGASGFVAGQLVEHLDPDVFDVLLVSRGAPRPTAARGEVEWCDYGDLPGRLGPGTIVLHLAAANSDESDLETALRVNVDFTLDVAEVARAAGVAAFVFVSSFHALDAGDRGPYAESKRIAVERLRRLEGLDLVVMTLPAVHGSSWSGKLAVLGSLPSGVGRALFGVAKAFRPTVHVRSIADRLHRMAVEGTADRDIVLSDDLGRNVVYRAFRGSVDLTFAFVVLVLGSWLLAGVWIAVRLTSPGPGFFVQDRVGRHGEIFRCWKFRTMREGTPQRGTHEVSGAAVTRLGRILRRTKVDELPQAWNVLRGDLSVIGPRPCLPSQVELVEARAAAGVLDMKPGITGLAQVNRVDMSDPARLVRWDLRYEGLRCVALDVRILLRTAFGGGRGDRTASGPPADNVA
jgi:lipopolysaccharide/colanic/teichoic acid biosynthesis glycosyltransferase